MTGAPAPRGHEAGTGSDSYLVRGFEQLRLSVETGFRELREQMAGFVTQREFERTTEDIADLRRQREQDQRDREQSDRARELAEQQRATERRNERWQRLALSIGTVTAIVTTIVGLIVHTH